MKSEMKEQSRVYIPLDCKRSTEYQVFLLERAGIVVSQQRNRQETGVVIDFPALKRATQVLGICVFWNYCPPILETKRQAFWKLVYSPEAVYNV